MLGTLQGSGKIDRKSPFALKEVAVWRREEGLKTDREGIPSGPKGAQSIAGTQVEKSISTREYPWGMNMISINRISFWDQGLKNINKERLNS